MTDKMIEISLGVEESQISTEWSNPPEIDDLKQNFNDAKPAKDEHTLDVDR